MNASELKPWNGSQIRSTLQTAFPTGCAYWITRKCWNLRSNCCCLFFCVCNTINTIYNLLFYLMLPFPCYYGCFIANTMCGPEIDALKLGVSHWFSLVLYCCWQQPHLEVIEWWGFCNTWTSSNMGYLAQQNNLWALESCEMTHLKCTRSSVYVQTHLAMININFQAALDRSALPTSKAIIREKVEIFLHRRHLC